MVFNHSGNRLSNLIAKKLRAVSQSFIGIVQTFSWSVIQSVHHKSYIFICYSVKAHALGKVLPDQAVCVLVQASLP